MSLLGFDAIGRLAVAQLPHSNYLSFVATVGSYVEAGQNALFAYAAPVAASSYSLSGIAASFGSFVNGAAASFSETGVNLKFAFAYAVSTANFILTGNPTTGALGGNVAASGGFVVTTYPTFFSFGYNVSPGADVVTSQSASLYRDYINWLPDPFVASSWTDIGSLSSTWTPITTPSTTWTADNAQYIPPPVTE